MACAVARACFLLDRITVKGYFAGASGRTDVTLQFAVGRLHLQGGGTLGLLGIEVADNGVTAAVYDIEGRVLARGDGRYEPESPQPGLVEIDVETVWEALKAVVGQAVSGTSEAVTAMSLAVAGEAVVPIDRTGTPLGAAILSDDRRGSELAMDFHERVSPIEIMRFTGMPAGPTYPLLELLWLKESRPDVYRDTWRFMGWQDYIVSRLGLEPTTDPSLAGRTQMFDIINGVWADGIIDRAGLDRDKLSEVRPAGTLLGEISRRAAEELGLPTGTRFVLGGYEKAAAALGVGAVSSGHALNATAGVQYLVPALNAPVVDPEMMKNGFACCPHVVPEMYVSIAYNATGTALLEWFHAVFDGKSRQTTKGTARDVIARLAAEMDDDPTDLLVLPYFTASGTPYLESKPMGSIVGLALDTTRGALSRALFEGLALEMKLNAGLLAASAIRIGELDVSGPAAGCRSWCQVKADVLGVPVNCHVGVDAAALGAAMLAGMGTGLYTDATAAVEFCVNVEERLLPNGPRTDVYETKFAHYRRLYPALRDILS